MFIDSRLIRTTGGADGVPRRLDLLVQGSAPNDVLHIALRPDRVGADGVEVGQTDASQVRFSNWEGLPHEDVYPRWPVRDRLSFSEGWNDPPQSHHVVGSRLPDVFDLYGRASHEVVDGGEGSEVLFYVFDGTSGIVMDGASRMVSLDGATSLTVTNVEQVDLELSSGGDAVRTGDGNDDVSGHDGNDVLHGGAGGDKIRGWSGNHTLHGEAGSDSLEGGAGNDTLLGGADNDALYGDDLYDDAPGRDRLDGGTGDDWMRGGKGDDTYVVDAAGDSVAEDAGQGSDTVESHLRSYALGASVEHLTLVGAAVTGTGNGLANRITGNGLANTLSGGGGADRIQGGGGADRIGVGTDWFQRDTVVFAAAKDSTGVMCDQVTGFDANGEDVLDLPVPTKGGVSFVPAGPKSLVKLDARTFDRDVALATDALFSQGGALEATAWQPLLGDAAAPGRVLVVADLDNSGAYEAGRDLVVVLSSPTGTIDAADFV